METTIVYSSITIVYSDVFIVLFSYYSSINVIYYCYSAIFVLL